MFMYGTDSGHVDATIIDTFDTFRQTVDKQRRSKHVTRAVVSNSWVHWYLCGVIASLPIREVLMVTVSYVDTKYTLYCAMPHVCIVAYQYIMVTPVLTRIASWAHIFTTAYHSAMPTVAIPVTFTQQPCEV